MTTDHDIRATATLLIERLGANAASKASLVAEAFAHVGYLERQRTWARITQAIESLQSERGRDPFEINS